MNQYIQMLVYVVEQLKKEKATVHVRVKNLVSVPKAQLERINVDDESGTITLWLNDEIRISLETEKINRVRFDAIIAEPKTIEDFKNALETLRDDTPYNIYFCNGGSFYFDIIEVHEI
ncbi:hypothetical protein H1S01_17230 [Heliobacterium chlorum]|uniref:Phage protein n=1 Tax=Heliobacterium chlorum TaxID=2698 RepID=A0ABR7T603_HELCL|nr:hypothetical protein [Heliobacterium chlorum]MBC9786208.1 hypothetical protein [Heliobacterium chlorum]